VLSPAYTEPEITTVTRAGGRKGTVDDYFAGSLASDRASVPADLAAMTSPASAAGGTRKRPPRPFSMGEAMFVVGCAAVGVALVLTWAAMGHPRTPLWRGAFKVVGWLPLVLPLLLLPPAGVSRHRFAVGVCGAFVAKGSVEVAAALWVLAHGTHHTGRVTTELLAGLLGVALFGGLPFAGRRLWRPDRTLSQEMADKVGPPPPGKQLQRVWLVLVDGRRVPASLVYGRQLARLPTDVRSAQVVDVQPR
jgi:hypothetical protein